jgi:hypothetical protein
MIATVASRFSSWPGFVPAIHVFLVYSSKDVDARHPSTPRLRRAFAVLGRHSFSEGGKAGHDGKMNQRPYHESLTLFAADRAV